jgi:hypothetical protein
MSKNKIVGVDNTTSTDAIMSAVRNLKPGQRLVCYVGNLPKAARVNRDVKALFDMLNALRDAGRIILATKRANTIDEDGVWEYIAIGATLNRKPFAGFDPKSKVHLRAIGK